MESMRLTLIPIPRIAVSTQLDDHQSATHSVNLEIPQRVLCLCWHGSYCAQHTGLRMLTASLAHPQRMHAHDACPQPHSSADLDRCIAAPHCRVATSVLIGHAQAMEMPSHAYDAMLGHAVPPTTSGAASHSQLIFCMHHQTASCMPSQVRQPTAWSPPRSTAHSTALQLHPQRAHACGECQPRVLLGARCERCRSCRGQQGCGGGLVRSGLRPQACARRDAVCAPAEH
mmetsp:Transcript_14788/g.36908  ORF Transcript_14788/g.36908 Transcript_14788/m.36908 type:complete len:229 (-) Transcript_14788:352-1038(-)